MWLEFRRVLFRSPQNPKTPYLIYKILIINDFSFFHLEEVILFRINSLD
jgi:hypothetical protein